MLSDVAELFHEPIAVPAADRRLTQRFLNAWACTARGHFPSWDALRNVDLGEDWNWVFVVDVEQSAGYSHFVYLGSKLAKLSDVYLTGATDWTMSVLDKAATDIDAAVRVRGPFFREDTILLCDGRAVMFRSVVAPLADDGENITHVAGVVNGRLSNDNTDIEPM